LPYSEGAEVRTHSPDRLPGKKRLDLQEQLLKAAESGSTHPYLYGGLSNHRDSLQEIMYFHVDSGKLFSVVDSLRQAMTSRERKFISSLSSVLVQEWTPAGGKGADMELKEMEALANLGTRYFLTTPVFDIDSFHQFMNRVGHPGSCDCRSHSGEIGWMGLFLNKYVSRVWSRTISLRSWQRPR